jgi:hypothetical protein
MEVTTKEVTRHMARNPSTDAAEQNTNGSEGVEGAQAAADTAKARSYIVVPVPPDVKSRFESEAKAADNKPVGPYVRDLLFGFLGIPIPETTTTRHSKYASKEEREAAQKDRNKSRSQTMKALMKAFRDAQAAGVSKEEAAELAGRMVAGTAPTTAEPEPEPTAA